MNSTSIKGLGRLERLSWTAHQPWEETSWACDILHNTSSYFACHNHIWTIMEAIVMIRGGVRVCLRIILIKRERDRYMFLYVYLCHRDGSESVVGSYLTQYKLTWKVTWSKPRCSRTSGLTRATRSSHIYSWTSRQAQQSNLITKATSLFVLDSSSRHNSWIEVRDRLLYLD